jgi:hypothetical protein
MEYGRLYFTAGIAETAHSDGVFLCEIVEALARYQLGDWGDLCKEDQKQNERALHCGARIMGSYITQRGGKIWIITEAEDEDGHRAATTVLYPGEY